MDSEETKVVVSDAEIRAGISQIASPLADEKLTGRALKLVRKAAKAKLIRRGVKEVIKGLRKSEKGLMVLAGNVTPIDVISHIPVLCEEANIPYIYVPAKEDLGTWIEGKGVDGYACRGRRGPPLRGPAPGPGPLAVFARIATSFSPSSPLDSAWIYPLSLHLIRCGQHDEATNECGACPAKQRPRVHVCPKCGKR